MKLIGSKTSPFVRKVRVVMAEKEIKYSFILEDVFSPETSISKSNPLGKVPCLVLKDGQVLFDSAVIVNYLDMAVQAAQLGIEAAPTAAPTREQAAGMVRAWSLVHGYATLLIDGRLDTILNMIGSKSDWQTLLSMALEVPAEAPSTVRKHGPSGNR